MKSMFHGCGNLTNITVGTSWSTTNVTSSTNMFSECTSIVGGAGTTYNSTKTNKTYARIDNPPDEPGYLTLYVPPTP